MMKTKHGRESRPHVVTHTETCKPVFVLNFCLHFIHVKAGGLTIKLSFN